MNQTWRARLKARLIPEATRLGAALLATAPLAGLDLLDEDWFFLGALVLYFLINLLGPRELFASKPAKRRKPRVAATEPAKSEEPSAARGHAEIEQRLKRARARVRKAEGGEALAETFEGLAAEYRAGRRAVLAAEPGAEAQAGRLRRVGGSLAELAEAAAREPGAERAAIGGEALREALERLREQRANLSGMADEAAFEANLETLRRRFPAASSAGSAPEEIFVEAPSSTPEPRPATPL